MKRELMIGPAVWAEIQCARAWYEEKQAGLGAQFAIAVDAAFAAIERAPASAPAFSATVRRRRLRRFPYSVFYTSDDQRIWLIAVFHASRDPEVLSARLRDFFADL